MTKKWTALLRIMGLVSGLNRQTKRPFRSGLILDLITNKSIRQADEIRLNTLLITLRQGQQTQSLFQHQMPLSDEEREALKAVLSLCLPKTTICQKIYEPELDLTHQCTYCFTKTHA